MARGSLSRERKRAPAAILGRYDAQDCRAIALRLRPGCGFWRRSKKASLRAQRRVTPPDVFKHAQGQQELRKRMRIVRAGRQLRIGLLTAAAGIAVTSSAALAAQGMADPWQIGMQDLATDLARGISGFHNWLVLLITLISLFVLALLVAVVIRFNEGANPTPSRTTHNTMIEVAWTIVPVLILVAIAIPSFRYLREQLIIPPHDLVVKATGHTWYWSYDYPADQGGGFNFDSNMIPETDLKPGQPRLLAADNEMVVPVNKVVKLQVTAADVLHSFGVPALGFTLDAIPGRLNEAWFRITREGVYYGQCRELCGNGHPYMPIQIRAVNEADYTAWLAQAKQKYAANGGDVKLAEAGK
jgi:cytochrome c oxidase subunit 2